MTLSLPADVEPHLGTDADLSDFHRPGVYALRLSRPDDVADAWDREFDSRPAWFDRFAGASGVVYVGGAADVLARLEDHRDGEVRTTVLTRVCEIESLRNVWWFSDTDEAFTRESKLAIMLQNEYPDLFVHQR